MKIAQQNFLLKITVTVTYLLMLVANALANIIPINGVLTGEVSDTFENLFAPAATTFIIWGVIYSLLLLYLVYKFGAFQSGIDSEKEELFKKIGIYFSISSLLNAIWIFCWHYYLIGISLAIIIGMLICLMVINQYIKKMDLSLKDYIFIRVPFSIYFGWLTVATIANVTTLLVQLG